MAETGRARYADAGGVKIAYEVTGRGPDVVIVPGLVSHVDLWWTDPTRRRFLRALAAFCRLVRYDKRGTGLSDPVTAPPSLEDRMLELSAVMAAAKCRRPIIIGWSEGGPIAIRYVAEHPEQVRGLVLYGTFARRPPAWVARVARRMAREWGTGISLELFAPSLHADADKRRAAGAMERASASPAMIRALGESVMNSEVRPILGQVRSPTLVLHRKDELIPIAEARLIARRMPGARLVELEGRDHLPWVGDTDAVVREIEAFVAEHGGTKHRPAARGMRPRRPLAGWASLTPAELRVVRLVAEGRGNQEIADTLFISRLTVETHLKRIFAKVGVTTRTELATLALKNT